MFWSSIHCGPVAPREPMPPATAGLSGPLAASLGTRFTRSPQLRPTLSLSDREMGPSGPKSEQTGAVRGTAQERHMDRMRYGCDADGRERLRWGQQRQGEWG